MSSTRAGTDVITHDGAVVSSDVVVEDLVLLPPELCAPLRVVQCGAMRNVAVVGEGSDLTGLFVWPGARFFCEFLAALRVKSGSASALEDWGCSGLVELGGGVGLGAFAASLLWSRLDCWVTDILEAALLLAVTQREHNMVELLKQRSTIRFGVLDWRWAAAAIRGELLEEVPKESSSEDLTILTPDRFQRIVEGWSPNEEYLEEQQPSSTTTTTTSGRHLPWLVGLDIVYPDHSDENMHNLCGCIASSLLIRRRSSAAASSILREQCTLLFIDRDVGVTLRRLIVCASLYGLTVTPLLSPFHNSGANSKADMLAWAAGNLAAPGATIESVAPVSWAAVHSGVSDYVVRTALSTKVSSGGDWLLGLSLTSHHGASEASHLTTSADLLTGCSRTSDGTKIVSSSVNSRWVSSLPWLWAPAGSEQFALWQSATSVAAVSRAVAIVDVSGPSAEHDAPYDVAWDQSLLFDNISSMQTDLDAMMFCCADLDDE